METPPIKTGYGPKSLPSAETLMKSGEIAKIQTKHFVEKPPGKAEPKLHHNEDDSSTGAELYQADLTVRAILSLQSTPETVERLSTFNTGIEQIKYLRLEKSSKCNNSTTQIPKAILVQEIQEL